MPLCIKYTIELTRRAPPRPAEDSSFPLGSSAQCADQLGVDSRHCCSRGVVLPMIFRSTIVAETRHDSTGALSSLLAYRPFPPPLSHSVSLCLFTPTSFYPFLTISRFSPPPIFCPSLLCGLALFPLTCLCPLLFYTRMSFSFRLALSLLRLRAIYFSLCHHRKLSFSCCFSHRVFCCPFLAHASLSVNRYLSRSLVRSVLLSLINQPSRWWHTRPPCTCALFTYNSTYLSSPSFIPYPQLLDAHGKDLLVAYFAKIDRSTINKILN